MGKLLNAISMALLVVGTLPAFAEEVSKSKMQRLKSEAYEHEVFKQTTKRIFQSASKQGVQACNEYLKGPKERQYELMFRHCVMWTAFHRKDAQDCKELEKSNQDASAASSKSNEIKFYQCIAVVAARTKNPKLCESFLEPSERPKCVEYSQSESDIRFWGNELWKVNVQG